MTGKRVKKRKKIEKDEKDEREKGRERMLGKKEKKRKC